VRSALPELPNAKANRFQEQYGLSAYDAGVLTAERPVADYYERVLDACPELPPKAVANWITGDLFGLLNQAGERIESEKITPQDLARLIWMVVQGEINQNTGKIVLNEMFRGARSPEEIVSERGLRQISDEDFISGLVRGVLGDNPEPVANYLAGKETIARWLFGQVMRAAKGQANPQVIQGELERQLNDLKESSA
jgi:aspartyl-tRNA(Asn)/glutamyl-tRNA(Gln) amidotransferase subunit B